MPKDKTLSHIRVINAARDEFLEKGFENASMRSIGEKAGMTPAGLYRHYPSKAALFEALVEPAITECYRWYKAHVENSYAQIDNNASKSELFNSTMLDFVRDVMYPNSDAFKLILLRSQGTKYANFIHDIVEVQQRDMLDALKYIKSKGLDVNIISEEEMHLIMSAYTTALFEPFIHNMSAEKIERCIKTIEIFFMPGWQKIMGY